MKTLPRFAFVLSSGVGLVGALAGCRSATGEPATTEAPTAALPAAPSSAAKGDDPKAVALLKRSMDAYAAMPSLKADCTFAMDSGGFPAPESKRTIAYERPNRFKVVSTNAMGFVQTAVSDGKSLLEFDNMTGQAPRQEAAPESIAKAASMQMKHPMFCGTLLYQFFGGSGNYDGLVDAAKGPVTFGAKETVEGEPSQAVKFYGREQYGHVEALIGERTGHVYRIRYDNEPVLKMMQDPETIKGIKAAAEAAAKRIDDPKAKAGAEAAFAATKGNAPLTLTTEERYAHLATPATFAADAFAPKPPAGTKPIDLSALRGPGDAPPVPIGSPAPDFTVTGLDGKTVSLASLRGRPVLLDFWATWCGPCVASLPHTQELHVKGQKAGLQVLAISDEDRATVAPFIKENRYTFPTALDTKRTAGQAYKTQAIPTTVVIDAQGKLVAYIVGGGQDEAIGKVLEKAGVRIE